MNNNKKSARRLCGLLVLSAIFAGVTVCVHSSSVLCPVLSRLSIYCIICWLGKGVSFPVALFGVCTCSWRSGVLVFSSLDFVLPPLVILHVVSYLDLRTGPWCHTFFFFPPFFFSFCVFSVMHAWVKKKKKNVWQNVLCCVHFSGGEGRWWGGGVTHPHTHTPFFCARVHEYTPIPPLWLVDYLQQQQQNTHTTKIQLITGIGPAHMMWMCRKYSTTKHGVTIVIGLYCVFFFFFFFFFFSFECSKVTLNWLLLT